MNKTFYKSLLVLLKGLIYLKRSIFFALSFIWRFVVFINNIYKATLGFAIFKIFFYIKKYFIKLKFFSKESKIEFFGRRGTLQILFFVVFLIIMYPHTRLYTRAFGEVPGHNSLLYKVVGPGDQDFYEEEIVALDNNTNYGNNPDWKSGTISLEAIKDSSQQTNSTDDLTSVTSGGTAIAKPTIIPGSTLVQGSGENATQIVKSNSNEVIKYTVQSGDVIGSISQKFGISVNTILWANNLNTRSYIQPNQVLTILPVDGVTHKVAKGDTVSRIANLYDAEASEIVKFNKLEADGADIVIGETLVVPGGEKETILPVVTKTTIVSRPSSFDNVVPVSSVATPAGSGYLWPTDAKIITQYYTWQHNGLDIASRVGTRIYATKAGTITVSQCGWNTGYGCYIKIDHGNGLTSLYGHNSQLLVNVGDYVTQGQNIALMGSTGNSSGSHVHFEIRVNNNNVNPLSYVRKP